MTWLQIVGGSAGLLAGKLLMHAWHCFLDDRKLLRELDKRQQEWNEAWRSALIQFADQITAYMLTGPGQQTFSAGWWEGFIIYIHRTKT